MRLNIKLRRHSHWCIVLTVILSVVFPTIIAEPELGDQHCGDNKCLEPISVGRTVLKYRANSNYMLSFNPSTPVKIFSKDLSEGGEIWGVEIEGKRGFVNKRHIQETRIFKSELGHRVTEGNESKSEINEPVNYVIDKSVDQQHQDSSDKNNEASLETKSNGIPVIDVKDTNVLEAEDTAKGDKNDIDFTEKNIVTNGDSIENVNTQTSEGSETSIQGVDIHAENFKPNSSETIPSDLQNPEPSLENKIDPVAPLSEPPMDGLSEENLESEKTPQITGESLPISPLPITLKKEPVVNIILNPSNTSISTSTVSHMPHTPLPPSIAKVLGYAGAHGTQINVSPEDMEFNRILDSFPQADFSSLPSITSTILKSIQTSVTATLQDHFDHSKVLASSVFVSASSISGDELNNESKQTNVVKGPTKTELLQDVSTATLEQNDEQYEVIDGTTLYLNEEPTNPTKEPQPIVHSSLVLNPSILSSELVSENRVPRQHLVDRDIVPTQLNDNKIGLQDNGSYILDEDVIRKNNPLHSEVEDQEIAVQPTQVLHDQQYASSNIEILPSAVIEQESKSEIPTPALGEPIQTAEIIQEESATTELTETNAQEQHISTEMSNQHVSTESDTHSIEIQGTNVENEIEKTVEYKPSATDVHPVKNTQIPSFIQHTPNDSESLPDTELGSEHETGGLKDESHENDPDQVQDNLNQDKYDSEDQGDNYDNIFEDFEDEEQDDEEEGFESEDIKEQRKKIVEENLQNAKENKVEVAISPDSYTLEDAVRNDEEDRGNIESYSDEENTNDVDDSISMTERTEGKEASNEDKGPFGSVNEENGKNLEVENINTSSETYLGNEINDEHHDSPSVTEVVNDIEISTVTSVTNEDIPNTLKKPGDDIKFYEPGDMIPPELSLASSDDVISDNEQNSIHQKASNNMEAVTETYKIEENHDGSPGEDKICCRAMTAECLACIAGISISEYCGSHLDTIGCEEYQTLQPTVTQEIDAQEDDTTGVETIDNIEMVKEDTESQQNNDIEKTIDDFNIGNKNMLDEEQRDEQYSEGTEHIKPEVKSNSEIPQENTEGEAINNDHQLEYPDIEGHLDDSNLKLQKDPNTPEEHNDANADQLFEKPNEFSEAEESTEAYPESVTNNDDVKDNPRSHFEDIFLAVIESMKDITPEWFHKSLHGENIEGVPPKLVMFLLTLTISVIILHAVTHFFDKSSREKPLLAKIAALDKALFKAKNDLLIVRKELDEARSKISFKGTTASNVDDFTTSTVVDSIKTESPSRSHFHQPTTHLVKEMESLKAEHDRIQKENHEVALQNQDVMRSLEAKSQEVYNLQLQLDQTSKELKDAENMVKEVFEKQRERQQAGSSQEDLVKAIETLRNQLDNQKKSVQKFESKIVKRETELKSKVQEVRKLRADAANANLAVDRVTVERDSFSKTIEEHKLKEEDMESKLKELEGQLIILKDTKTQLFTVKDNLDNKESELETKCTEIEVLKETLKTLTLSNDCLDKTFSSHSNEASTQDSGDKPTKSHLISKVDDGGDRNSDDDVDGWEDQSFEGFGEEDEGKGGMDGSNSNSERGKTKEIMRSSSQVDARMVAAIQEMSQYKVDLSKATEACDRLNDQLTTTEKERSDISCQLSENESELKVARAAKDEAVRVKLEIEQKHQVLTDYYNQRESELQKQLGLLSAKLGDSEDGKESSAKKLSHLFDELESYKAQCKSYKAEMEEQERSLKSQNTALEKRHHESWVTVRQESRKMADAQNEMQTLRNRLTVAETKLLEREVEIRNYQEETKTLKDAVENLAEQSSVSSQMSTNQHLVTNGSFANGTSLIEGVPTIGAAGAIGINSSDGGSLTGNGANDLDVPPPDLPPLPMPSMPHAVYPHVSVVPPIGRGVIPQQFQAHQQPMSNFPAEIMRRPPPLGRRSPPRGSGGQAYSRSPSPPPDDERYQPKADRRHNLSSARSDISNRGRTRRDIGGSGYDSYGTSGYDYSPPPSPRYSHNHGEGRRSSRHSPDRYSARSGQSGSEWTDQEYHENSQGRRREPKIGAPLRDEMQSDKRRQRPYMENGETTEDDRLGYASGSNTFRDRPNHHSRRHKNVLGDDSGHGGAQQGKNGPKTSSPMV